MGTSERIVLTVLIVVAIRAVLKNILQDTRIDELDKRITACQTLLEAK